MANTPHSSGHHDHEHHGDHEHHAHDPHNWASADYVSNWAKEQDQKEAERQDAFRLMAETIPYDKKLPIKILDVGAGYGALTQFLLNHYSNATAVCQDGSDEMTKLGQERMADIKGRFEYVLCDFSKAGWSAKVPGSFDAVVSSLAIHNVQNPSVVRSIYQEIFPLVKNGGCFLNYDLTMIPLEDHLEWLRGAGFPTVSFCWRDEKRALFGGFRK
jgi:ubiquinone/menaquinone biosynthesis C-methylase UbiE